jgi:putative SOS response-associated peptidase YedK
MCGRFTLTINPDQLHQQFGLSEPPPTQLAPRYNIAPTQAVAVIANNRDHRKLELFQWGLIPSWAKDPKIGSKMINARAETLAEKPSFRTALKRRRCLVVADGFYEWKKTGSGKTPMYIQLKDGQPFGFAGLWEAWQSPEDGLIKTCTIITTTPNALLAGIHDRMPVILPREAYDQWLAPEELPAVETLPLLQAYDAAQMRARPVSTLVNSPAVDSAELIQPVAA